MTGDSIPRPADPAGGHPQSPLPTPGGMSWQKDVPPQQQQPPLQQHQQGYGFPPHAAPAHGPGVVPPGQPSHGGWQPPPPPGGPAPYPGQPPYGAPTQPPVKKSKTGLIVLLAVALLVLGGAGAGAYLLLSGSSNEGVLWSQPNYKGKLPPGEQAKEVMGTWVTDKTVIQTLPDGVKAYNVATGKRVWATPIPGAGTSVCEAPRESDGGIGIVAFGVNKACDHLVAYDLNTGKQLWTKQFKAQAKPKPKGDKRFQPGDTTPKESGGTYARSGDVVVAKAWGGAYALKTSDGSFAWKPEETAKCDGVGSYTGGKALIRVRACHTKPVLGVAYDEVSKIDPASGKAEWTYTFHPKSKDDLDAGMAVGGQVVSTDPVVLLPDREDMGLMALDTETGKLRSRFSPGTPARYVQTHEPEGSTWMQAGSFGNTFVISAAEADNNGNLLAAYDLDSGKLLWKTKADDNKDYYPLPGANGNKIIAYVRNNASEQGPALVQYDAKTGTPHTVVDYPVELREGLDLFARPYCRDGRLFLTAIGDQTFMGRKGYSIVALKLR